MFDAKTLEIDVPGLVALRRRLNDLAELAFEDHATAALIAKRLRSRGLQVEEGIGGTGVLGCLEGGQQGKTLMFRAELDAFDLSRGAEAADLLGEANIVTGWRNPFADDVAFFTTRARVAMCWWAQAIQRGGSQPTGILQSSILTRMRWRLVPGSSPVQQCDC